MTTEFSQRTFAGGEVAPELYGRNDLKKYDSYLRKCRNFIVTPQGAVVNRPGTKFVAETKASAAHKSRLVTFNYGGNQNFVMEFGHQYIRFYQNGNQVMNGAVVIPAWNSSTAYAIGAQVSYNGRNWQASYSTTNTPPPGVDHGEGAGFDWIDIGLAYGPIEVTTPYVEADLFLLKYAQSGDIVTIVHPNYAPAELRRLSNTNWTLANVPFWNMPTAPPYKAIGISGTESGNIWRQFAITAVYADGRESLPRFSQYICLASTNTDAVIGVRGVQSDGPIMYRFYMRTLASTVNPYTNSVTGLFDYSDFSYIGMAPYANNNSALWDYNVCSISDPMHRTIDFTTHPPAWYNPFVGVPQPYSSGFYNVGARVTNNGNTYECVIAGYAGKTPPIHTAGYATDGIPVRKPSTAYNVNDSVEVFGVQYLCYVAGTTNANNSIALDVFDISTISPWADGTCKWITTNLGSEGPYPLNAVTWKFVSTGTAKSTYPSVVAYFEQRIVYADTYEKPSNIWASRVGDFYTMYAQNVPALDDDPLSFSLNALRYEEVRWLIPLRALMVGTSESTWQISGASGAYSAITAASKMARVQSYRGTSWIDPILLDRSAIVNSQIGSLVLELVWDFYTDTYQATDMTAFATHLFRNYTINDWAYQRYPYSGIWATRSDGILLGCTYLREQEVLAWYHHDTQGTFESVCSVREGMEEAVYVIVNRRTGDGHIHRYVERFQNRILPLNALGEPDDTQGVFLDAARTWNVAPTTNFSGLDHLEGLQVNVLADGNVMGPYTVNGGAIDISVDLPDGASVVIAGLPYVSDLETTDLAPTNVNIRSNLKSLFRISFEVANTRGFWFGTNWDNLKEWQQREVSDGYGKVNPFTGLAHVRFPSHFEHNARACLRQVDPLPVTLMALGREVDVGGD
jgi:hypothetical protein